MQKTVSKYDVGINYRMQKIVWIWVTTCMT